MNCPTSNHDKEAEDNMADYWFKMYNNVCAENEKLKKKIRTLSRIDVIGQNGNEGEHYAETKE